MLTVHHLNNSRSQRILWLLEELELDYELNCYQRDLETNLAAMRERCQTRPAYKRALQKGGRYDFGPAGQ